VYTVTAKGRRARHAGLAGAPAVGTERLEWLAQVWFLDETPARALPYFEALRAAFAQELAALEAIESWWRSQDPAYPKVAADEDFFPQLTLALGLRKLREEGTVKILKFDDSLLRAFLTASRDVVAEAGAGDDLSKKIYASYQQFRTSIMDWSEVAERTESSVRFGTGTRADVRAEDVTVVPAGTRWTLKTPTGSAEVLLPLQGTHNVSNALAAAAAMWSIGASVDEIADSLCTIPQVAGRLECVARPPDAPTVLIDYAHTPDALARVLAAVRPLVPGKVIVVFGAGGDRDPGKRPEMGRVAAMGADLAVVTSDNPRTEDPEAIIDDIEAGMGDAPRLRVSNRREAIRRALAEAGPEDLVLLAGKGHETYQIWGGERHPFDEREVVRSILAEERTRE
jgi:hypothetical protein